MQKIETYTEILRGKDAKNNKRILKTLTEKREPMNVAELTQSMLRKGTSRYSKEYASLNSVIFRRVQALAKMKYLVKGENNKYSLSLKAKLFVYILFPNISRSTPVITGDEWKRVTTRLPITQQILSETIFEIFIIRPFEFLLTKGKISLDIIEDDELLREIREQMIESVLIIQSGKELTPKERNELRSQLEKEKTILQDRLALIDEFMNFKLDEKGKKDENGI